MYEDMVLAGLMSDKAVDIIKTMPILDGDVIVATYPKTGRIFLLHIKHGLHCPDCGAR